MAVAGTVYVDPKLLDGKHRLYIKSKYNLDIPFEFSLSGMATGDGSGGSVTFTFDLGTLNPDVYYYFTRFITNQTASTDHKLTTNSDQWDILHNINITSKEFVLWVGEGVYNSFSWKDQLSSKPLYLGKPRNIDANGGEITYEIATNTESNIYRVIILGFATKDPPPLASLPDITN